MTDWDKSKKTNAGGTNAEQRLFCSGNDVLLFGDAVIMLSRVSMMSS
jgi:hypothetical protein